MLRTLRSVLPGLAVALFPAMLAAQFMGPPDTTSGPPKAATTFGIGVQALDVSEFNTALRAKGFPTMDGTAVTAGFSTEIRFGRWDVSFAGGGILGRRDESATWVTETKGSALMIGAGYAIVDDGRWRVVPHIGAGFAKVDYHIEQVRGGTVDSVLADPLRGTDLDGQTAIWHTGVGVSYRLGRKMGQKLSLAFRVGYAMALNDTDWKTDDNDLGSGPRAAYGGGYARIGLSMGIPKRKGALFPALFSVIPWLSR